MQFKQRRQMLKSFNMYMAIEMNAHYDHVLIYKFHQPIGTELELLYNQLVIRILNEL